MKHIAAHYDGEKVVLDEPVHLPANTPLEIIIPDSEEDTSLLRQGLFLASLPTLRRIWLNSSDAAYDDV